MKTSTKSILGGRVEVIGPADCVGAVASHIETTISGPAAVVQPLKPVLDDPPKQCSCPNCDWAGTSAEMKRVYPDIPDLAERMDPGEECPVGECPKCGALCHEDEPETVSLPVAQAAEIAKLRAACAQALSMAENLHKATGDAIPGGIVWTLRTALDGVPTEPLRVLIEVRGGVAEVTTCPAGVEVEIVDHDNERTGI